MARQKFTTDQVEAHYGAHRSAAERPGSIRRPLTASQHILHLLLTVVTAGLWLPVWIIRATQGNRRLR